jgi:hypothetical protein
MYFPSRLWYNDEVLRVKMADLRVFWFLYSKSVPQSKMMFISGAGVFPADSFPHQWKKLESCLAKIYM